MERNKLHSPFRGTVHPDNTCHGCNAQATRWSGHDVWIIEGGRMKNLGCTYVCDACDPTNSYFLLVENDEAT